MTTQFESATADPAERAFLLRHAGEPGLSVRHAPGPGPSLLYVHGSTFPAASSMNYRIDGTSWADDLQSRGFDVWSFDFAGYGGSDRPRPMQDPARGTIPGRASEAVRQIERVVRHVLAQSGRRQLSIIAHSWGTIPAGLFAGRHPEQLDRLILFGPVAERRDKGETWLPTPLVRDQRVRGRLRSPQSPPNRFGRNRNVQAGLGRAGIL